MHLIGQLILTTWEGGEGKRRWTNGVKWNIHLVTGNRQQWLRILKEILKINFKCFLHGKSKVEHFIHHYWPDSFISCLSFWLYVFFPFFVRLCSSWQKWKKKVSRKDFSPQFLCRRIFTKCVWFSGSGRCSLTQEIPREGVMPELQEHQVWASCNIQASAIMIWISKGHTASVRCQNGEIWNVWISIVMRLTLI